MGQPNVTIALQPTMAPRRDMTLKSDKATQLIGTFLTSSR
jgi:hypothetical protein